MELNLRLLAITLAAIAVLLTAGPVLGLNGAPLILVELAVLAAMIAGDRHYSPQIGRWLRGAEGEREVGQVLAGLEADGWHALHDVSLGRGNVDHIAIGPGGIFTIETKSHRGRIAIDRLDPAILGQAYAEKKLVERITGLDVQPLLVFSRAWLIGSVPARRKGVTVLPARMLQHYFSRRRPLLSPAKAAELHRRLSTALAAPSTSA